jgi:hypothetical protein
LIPIAPPSWLGTGMSLTNRLEMGSGLQLQFFDKQIKRGIKVPADYLVAGSEIDG